MQRTTNFVKVYAETEDNDTKRIVFVDAGNNITILRLHIDYRTAYSLLMRDSPTEGVTVWGRNGERKDLQTRLSVTPEVVSVVVRDAENEALSMLIWSGAQIRRFASIAGFGPIVSALVGSWNGSMQVSADVTTPDRRIGARTQRSGLFYVKKRGAITLDAILEHSTKQDPEALEALEAAYNTGRLTAELFDGVTSGRWTIWESAVVEPKTLRPHQW